MRTDKVFTAVEAVRRLCVENIRPVLEPLNELVDSNVFRKQELYK